MMGPAAETTDLYATLGLSSSASEKEIRRAYRTLATSLHPDKLTQPDAKATERWQKVQHAWEVLSDARKRKLYDTTGTWQRGADEEFMEAFAGGAFRDRGKGMQSDPDPVPLDQLIVVKPTGTDKPSHSAGFEAWLRSRGMENGALFTAEDAAAAYGVTRTSYEAAAIPGASEPVPVVRCTGAGKPRDVFTLDTESLPAALEWGQILVSWLYAPINPADLYSARLGGVYATESTSPPYAAGHDGVGMVTRVGPGVKEARVGDLVLPARSFVGTWRSAAVLQETDVLCLPRSTRTILSAMHPGESHDTSTDHGASTQPTGPLLSVPKGSELLALSREALVAYLLLERHGALKPGDCVLINAPTSSVGQALLQLARLLKLRAVAVARKPTGSGPGGDAPATRAQRDQQSSSDPSAWSRLEAWLKGLGATVVIPDEGSVRVELDKFKFFAKPKLALDAVGGASAVRLAEALVDGGEVVCYGCLSGQSPVWPWQQWVFRDVKVSGFNLRRWLSTGGGAAPSNSGLGAAAVAATNAQALKRLVPALESLLKLVAAGLLQFQYTQYDLTEFTEALEHAEAPGRSTKVLLNLQPTNAL